MFIVMHSGDHSGSSLRGSSKVSPLSRLSTPGHEMVVIFVLEVCGVSLRCCLTVQHRSQELIITLHYILIGLPFSLQILSEFAVEC